MPTDEQNSAFDVTITFSEDVTGFSIADDVTFTGPATLALKSGDQGPKVYTATITPNTGDIENDVTLKVKADTVKDAADNDNAASATHAVYIDTIDPTVSIGVPTDAQNSAFDITITFSEDMTGFSIADDVTFTGPATLALKSGDQGPKVYTATITPNTGGVEGDASIKVKADTVKDAAQNDNTASTTHTVHIDTIPPTVEITGVPTIEKNSAFDMTVTFSEDVNGFQVPNSLTLTGPASASLKSGSDGDSEYTVTITPNTDAEGDVTIKVKAGAARDSALNNNTVSAETDPVHVDTIPPTVEITGLPDVAQKEPFDLTITFSEVVNGFEVPGDLTVTGPVGVRLKSGSDGDSEYTIAITPDNDSEDDVEIQVEADVVTDFARNENTASDEVLMRIDTIAPTVAITDLPEDIQLEAFSITIAFSEDVNEFELSDITFSGDAVVADSELTGTGSAYTLTITPHEDTDGDVTIEVPEGIAEDEATNLNTASASQTVSVAPKWIPDPNIRVAIRRSLGLAVGEDFSQDDMLDLVHLSAAGLEIIDLTGLEYATNLSVADLAENEIVDLSSLEDLTELTTLDLDSNDIIDLLPLENLFDLGTLTLSNNLIEEILPLAGLTSIITLNLSYNVVSDVSALTDFVALTHLDLTNNQVKDVSPLEGLEDLEILRVSGNPILDAKQLIGLATLIEVDGVIPQLISDPGLAEEVRKALGLDTDTDITTVALQDLKTLETAPSHIRSLTGLEHATALTTLKISGNVITDLTPLADLTQLTTLELNDNAIQDLTPLADLTQLTTLKLNSNTISDLISIRQLTALTTLEIADNAIEDLTPLAALKDLTTLNLSRNAITDLAPLAGLISLTLLDFSSNAIDNVETLGGLTGVTLLNLNGNSITDLTPLAELTRLTTLRLSNNSITDLSPLTSLTNLNVLALNANSVTDLSVLSGLTQLSTLTLGDNPISNFTPLASLTQLRMLSLSGNGISTLNFLTPLTLLIILDLTSNDISDVAPIAILEDLGVLRLVDNPILDTTPLYPLTQRVPPVDIDIAVSEFRPWDVNTDGNVDTADVTLVEAALGQTGESLANPRTDVNRDGAVDDTDLMLVNERLDDAAAAPASTDTPTLLNETLLLANYPNPFNPETWIPYQLAHTSHVEITIYDTQGAIIRHLKLGYQPVGDYTAKHRAAYWDGRNSVGERVSSGVYFYRLQTDDVSLTRKMLILK